MGLKRRARWQDTEGKACLVGLPFRREGSPPMPAVSQPPNACRGPSESGTRWQAAGRRKRRLGSETGHVRTQSQSKVWNSCRSADSRVWSLCTDIDPWHAQGRKSAFASLLRCRPLLLTHSQQAQVSRFSSSIRFCLINHLCYIVSLCTGSVAFWRSRWLAHATVVELFWDERGFSTYFFTLCGNTRVRRRCARTREISPRAAYFVLRSADKRSAVDEEQWGHMSECVIYSASASFSNSACHVSP